MILRGALFLLPFALYCGIALQGIGYYLFALLIPALSLFPTLRVNFSNIQKVGFCLLFLYIIFPLWNFINWSYILQLSNSEFYFPVNWKAFLQGPFSSSFFFTSLVLIATPFLFYRKAKAKNIFHTEGETEDIIKYFILGLFPASILFFSYLLIQYFTGFDPRRPDYLIGANDQLANGYYRTFGFYGHPLTVAAVGLGYFAFFWTLFWQCFGAKKEQKFKYLPFASRPIWQSLCLLTIALCNLGAVMTTVGRTALAISFVFFLIIPLFFLKKQRVFIFVMIGILVAALGFFTLKKVGIEGRLHTSVTKEEVKTEARSGDYRLIFWETYIEMIKERPMVGFGGYWLENGIRDHFYDRLGYANIPQKYNAHNNYLEVLASVGIIGVVFILLCIYRLLKIFRFSLRKKHSNSILSVSFLAALVANLLHAITQNVFFDSSVTYIYLSLLILLMWQNFTYKLKSP